jgi:hypothetical protein
MTDLIALQVSVSVISGTVSVVPWPTQPAVERVPGFFCCVKPILREVKSQLLLVPSRLRMHRAFPPFLLESLE